MPFPDFPEPFPVPARKGEELCAADAVTHLERRHCRLVDRFARRPHTRAVFDRQAWPTSSFCVAQPVVSHYRNPEAVSFPPPSMFPSGALCNDFVYRQVGGAPSAGAH